MTYISFYWHLLSLFELHYSVSYHLILLDFFLFYIASTSIHPSPLPRLISQAGNVYFFHWPPVSVLIVTMIFFPGVSLLGALSAPPRVAWVYSRFNKWVRHMSPPLTLPSLYLDQILKYIKYLRCVNSMLSPVISAPSTSIYGCYQTLKQLHGQQF